MTWRNLPTLPADSTSFAQRFEALFHAHHAKLQRVLHRHSGDRELAADVVQEAFVRLYRRGEMPDAPEAWLVTVALNRMRNEKAARARHLRLLTPARAESLAPIAGVSPEQSAAAAESRDRVRAALTRLPERDRGLLLLSAEGYRYRDIATALDLNEASIGTLLARARRAFRAACGDLPDAP